MATRTSARGSTTTRARSTSRRFGILWLVGRERVEDARAVERFTDATMRVEGRRVNWPGASGQSFAGYRPFTDGPNVLWLEGTLMMRLAKARLGSPVAELDRNADRWAALTAPRMPLQVDRAAGEDYHVWPAAAPAAWLALSPERVRAVDRDLDRRGDRDRRAARRAPRPAWSRTAPRSAPRAGRAGARATGCAAG